MEVKRSKSKDESAAEAGEYLNAVLIENKNRPILLMLSAGSALSILEYVGATALGEHITISILDERFSQDPKINNFHQLQQTDFYTLAFAAEASFFGTLPRPDDTQNSLAERWEKNLRSWRQQNPNGIIIATLGMGQDGHTFGVLPYPENEDEFRKLFVSENWVRAYNAGAKNKFPERITTTLTFLKNFDIGLAFVCGPEKKQKLDAVIKKQGETYALPALAWHDVKDVKIFTDIQP